MAGYTDPDRYPSIMAQRLTLGGKAASYGIGFLIYGIIGLASGELLGLDSIRFLHEHNVAASVSFVVVGLLLFALGLRDPG